MRLFEVFHVHEVVVVAIRIEKLHRNLIDDDTLDRVGRAEAVLEHGSGAQITQLSLNESAQVARGAMLHAENSVQLIVVLDDHARTHLGGGNRHTEKAPNGYL